MPASSRRSRSGDATVPLKRLTSSPRSPTLSGSWRAREATPDAPHRAGGYPVAASATTAALDLSRSQRVAHFRASRPARDASSALFLVGSSACCTSWSAIPCWDYTKGGMSARERILFVSRPGGVDGGAGGEPGEVPGLGKRPIPPVWPMTIAATADLYAAGNAPPESAVGST